MIHVISHLLKITAAEGQAASRVELRFPGNTTTVNESNLAGCIEHLRKSFRGYVSCSQEGSAAAWRILLFHVPALEYKTGNLMLLNESPAGHGRVFRMVAGSSSTEAAFLFPNTHLVVVHYPTKCIHVYGTEYGLSTAAVHLNRQILSDDVQGFGGLVVHAAGLAMKGKGIALFGDKGAGKTTLLLASVMNVPHSSYISNDRVVITKKDGILSLGNWPHKWGVTPHTAAMFPQVRDSIRGVFSGKEAQKAYVFPWLLTESAGMTFCGKAPFRLAVCVSLDLNNSRPIIRSLPRQRVISELRKQVILTRNDAEHPEWLWQMRGDSQPAEGELSKMLGTIARDVECVSLTAGSDITDTYTALARLLEL